MRTWFDQPGRKLRRRTARKTKAATLGVRPLTLLRPAVRGQTVRYNRKVREGRGFTLGELKEAGIGKKEARGVGIVVDHRRRNLSEEGKLVNVERLKAYKEKLIVFPRKTGKPKKGDSSVSLAVIYVFFQVLTIAYQAEDLTATTSRAPIPLPAIYQSEAPRKITSEEQEFEAFKTLRTARANQRHEGARKARAAKVRRVQFSVLPTNSRLHTERGRRGSKEEVDYCTFSSFFLRLSLSKFCTTCHILHTMPMPHYYAVNMEKLVFRCA